MKKISILILILLPSLVWAQQNEIGIQNHLNYTVSIVLHCEKIVTLYTLRDGVHQNITSEDLEKAGCRTKNKIPLEIYSFNKSGQPELYKTCVVDASPDESVELNMTNGEITNGVCQ